MLLLMLLPLPLVVVVVVECLLGHLVLHMLGSRRVVWQGQQFGAVQE